MSLTPKSWRERKQSSYVIRLKPETLERLRELQYSNESLSETILRIVIEGLEKQK